MKLGIVDTAEVDRNRQAEKYPKGARISHVVGHRINPNKDSTEVEVASRKVCAKAWEAEWGPIPWDRVRISHRYLTFQILTEFVVYPEGW